MFFCYSGDIIIERWCPYGPQSERRTIVQPAPPPMKYPAPTHTVVVYDAIQPNIVRKFERLGATQEDPAAYVGRYGASLLDSEALVRQARQAGITEDIVRFFENNIPQKKLLSFFTIVLSVTTIFSKYNYAWKCW